MITLVASAMSGYAFARLNFRFQGGLFVLYLSTLIVPQEVIVIPMFLVMQRLGWVNSYQALILPWAFTAFGTFLLRQFFLSAAAVARFCPESGPSGRNFALAGSSTSAGPA